MTTVLSIKIQCREQPRTGSVQINGTVNVCPVVDGISASPGEVMVGFSSGLSATAHDSDGRPAAITYSWVATSGMLAGATTPAPMLLCTAAGTSTVTLTVSDGDCADTSSVTIVCSPAPAAPALVRINEVESDQGVPGDWVELTNAGGSPADIGGYIFRDNSDANGYVIPAGTTLAPGGYYLLEVAAFTFGLGGGDSARLFDPAGVLVDSYTWTAHATTTYGRCPDGTGGFVNQAASSKGAANVCGGGMGGAGGGAAGAGGGAGGGLAGAGGGAAGAGGGAAGAGGGAPPALIVINEVESSGGVPGDWVELYNAGTAAVDLGGWVFRDTNETPQLHDSGGDARSPPGGYLRPGRGGVRLRAGRRGVGARLRPDGHAGRFVLVDRARDHDLRPLPERHRRVRHAGDSDQGRGKRLRRRRGGRGRRRGGRGRRRGRFRRRRGGPRWNRRLGRHVAVAGRRRGRDRGRDEPVR